ncbi:ABC transporter permease [Clostridium sporogenes]|uniref:ABC transporter permease n=1 Tax=Clostridium sporogenes TaxID=1509 RepID=UPI0015EEF1C2|nr:ABC transporter permease [Clostridium sporogenes]MBA4509321.1 ABC transporter permease [Clostridium sporogenes]MDU6336318.1 ABC transporter permease [Clostridium sporogenes]
MLNIVICELKKFKRIWIPLIIGVFLVIQFSSVTLNTAVMKNADDLFTWVNLTVFSYGFLAAINMLIAYMFMWEFNNNTMLLMLTYKHKRWKVFVAKIISAILISLLLYIIEFLMLTLMNYISFRDTLTTAVMIKHLMITLKAFFFQMLMITVTASVAIVSKKIIVPVIYIGIQLVASFIFLSELPIRAFIPFPLPVIPNLMLIRNHYKIIKDISIMPSQVIIATVMFVGGIAYGCWYINKMEVEQ